MWAEYLKDTNTSRPNVRSLVKLLGWLTKKQDPDGVDLHFFISANEKTKCKESSALVELLRATDFGGTSSPSTSLKPFLEDYRDSILAYKKDLGKKGFKFFSKKKPRRLSVYVLTDGVWESPDKSDMADGEYLDHTIITLVEALVAVDFERDQIGIHFISFGNHEFGQKRLKHLDRLNKTNKLAL